MKSYSKLPLPAEQGRFAQAEPVTFGGFKLPVAVALEERSMGVFWPCPQCGEAPAIVMGGPENCVAHCSCGHQYTFQSPTPGDVQPVTQERSFGDVMRQAYDVLFGAGSRVRHV